VGAKDAKPKRTAANANRGAGRQKAAKPAAKSKQAAAPTRRAG
jgi:DNA end-binding protein Ku